VTSVRECDDDYEAIVAKWGSERVIECGERLQWIWQKRRGKEWRSLKFFRSREGILRRVKPDEAAFAVLSALPDMYLETPPTRRGTRRGPSGSLPPDILLNGSSTPPATAQMDPLIELADGCGRIAAMINPTIEAIRRELAGWGIEDDRTIRTLAWRMRVAPTAVCETLEAP
jgi:hypothetical protein